MVFDMPSSPVRKVPGVSEEGWACWTPVGNTVINTYLFDNCYSTKKDYRAQVYFTYGLLSTYLFERMFWIYFLEEEVFSKLQLQSLQKTG